MERPLTLGVDRIIFQTPLVKIGALRCPPQHARFEEPGPTENFALVFPRSCSAIHRNDDVRFVATPSIVAPWNRGQVYRREALCPEGAVADWFAFDRDLVLDTARSLDPCVENMPERPFRVSHIRATQDTYLAQRKILRHVLRGEFTDAVSVEERALKILRRTIEESHRQWKQRIVRSEPYRPSLQDEVIWRAETHMARHFRDSLSIAEIAKQAGTSPFHLCRLFKKRRNTTLHARRNQIRLGTALEYIMDTAMDLTEIALLLGFSSHSHFTSAFRRHFGMTPSSLR